MKKPTYTPHLLCYTWATQFVHNKNVIDVGCGEGYGALILSMFAKRVLGLDNSPRAARVFNMHKFLCPSEIFEIDIERTTLPLTDVDVYVAFEVLEHIDNPQVLKDKPFVVFSVPHDYPHRLHKTIYRNEDEVRALFPGRSIDFWYLTGTSIVKDKPAKIDRYIGVVQ